MKKGIIFIIVSMLAIMLVAMLMCSILQAEYYPDQDGCFICYDHDHYVAFKGKNTPEMRQRALDEKGCKVYAITSQCYPSNFSSLVRIEFLNEK
jgi:hypothetical protein